jgi:hypothetical protein
MGPLEFLVDVLRDARPAQEYGDHSDMHVWAGLTPVGSEEAQADVAARIGVGAPVAAELLEIDQAVAQIWLSLFARISLTHMIEQPETEKLSTAISEGFAALGPAARFYSNGVWTLTIGRGLPEIIGPTTPKPRRRRQHHYGWQPRDISRMPNATVDGGIIGVGDTYSFVFWVNECD